MKNARSFAAVLAFFVATGCAYPITKTEQGGVSSALSFAGLPAAAVVVVDGTTIGTVADYATKVLAVAPGAHRVVVQSAGQTLVDREFYVGRDSIVKVAP
jgi:hypothetical protein